MSKVARRITVVGLCVVTVVPVCFFSASFAFAATSNGSSDDASFAAASCRPTTASAGTVMRFGDASVDVPIHVRVIGGRLELGRDRIDVPLRRAAGDHFIGRLDDLRVMDTRGTYVGWTLTASVNAPARIVPDDVTVLDGFSDGLGNPGSQVSTGAPVTLARAAAGCGAGIYSVGATIDVELDNAPNDDATITLEAKVA